MIIFILIKKFVPDTQLSLVEAVAKHDHSSSRSRESIEKLSSHRQLYCEIQDVFSDLVSTSSLLKSVFNAPLQIT